MQIIKEYFIAYKFANALFTGLSIGTIISIYTPLHPSIYSLGGVALALGMLVVARMYDRLFTIEWFYRITLFVELVLLAMVLYFLSSNISYETALLIYIGYQLTFLFGSYLVRAETIFLNQTKTLSDIDSFKQIGSIFGMVASYLFYKHYDKLTNIEQVYNIHYPLLAVQIIVIFFVLKSFVRR